MPIEIVIDEYGNGYRPTASGRVGDRAFTFRLMGEGWFFGIGRAGVDDVWWHDGPDELEFETGGDAEPVWHTESLPYFLEGLRRYLESRGVQADERESSLAIARELAQRLFSDA